jgi:hypothetical protein
MLTPLTGKNVNPQLVKGILENLGVTPSPYKAAYQEAAGREAGKRSVTGGGASPALIKSVGTDDFYKNVDKEADKLDFDDRMKLELMHDRRVKAKTVGDADGRLMPALRGAVDSLDRVVKAYEATPAAQTGKVSETLRTALALTQSGASAQELSQIVRKLTPEERKYIAEYNTFQLNLRSVSQDSRFSNFDSQRVLQAVGNPIVGKDLYMDQAKSALNELTNRYENVLDGLEARGKDVSKYPRFRAKAQPAGAPTGKVRVVNPNGKAGYIPESQLEEALKAGYKKG